MIYLEPDRKKPSVTPVGSVAQIVSMNELPLIT